MSVVLELEPEVEETLKKRAAARGSEFNVYLQGLLKEQASKRSYEEVMTPVWDAFERTGMTEDELGELIDREVKAVRAERRSRREQRG